MTTPNFPVNNEQIAYSRGDIMAFLKPLLEAIISSGGGGMVGYNLEATQLLVKGFLADYLPEILNALNNINNDTIDIKGKDFATEAKQKGYSQTVTTGITLTGTNILVIKNNSLKNTTFQLFTNSIAGTGYRLEGSMDGTNYDAIVLAKTSLASGALVLDITTSGNYTSTRNDGNFPYLRLRSLLAGNSANIQYSLTENV